MDVIKSDTSTTSTSTKTTKKTTKSKTVAENLLEWKKKPLSVYSKTYTSYSGHDMVCVFEIPLSDGKTISQVVGSLQTISYSIHNEKMPVRVLGNMNMKSIVFGSRTIAGSIIFTVFDKHWVKSLLNQYYSAIKYKAHALTDELPDMNISIAMMNEYGDKSRLALYGVTFVNEGQTMSINDMYTENTFQFYAKDIDYLTTETTYNTSKGLGTKKTVNKKANKINSDSTETNTKIDNTSSSGSSKVSNSAVGSDEQDSKEKIQKDTSKLVNNVFTAIGLTGAVNKLAARIANLGLPNSAAQPLILALRNAEKRAKQKMVKDITANKTSVDSNEDTSSTEDSTKNKMT